MPKAGETSTAREAVANEVYCKILGHNICRLVTPQCEVGVEPFFWQDDGGRCGAPVILPVARPG